MDSNSNGEEPKSWEELYSINLIPSELFFKFRKEQQGLRVGLNLEVYIFYVLFFYLRRLSYAPSSPGLKFLINHCSILSVLCYI